jgi:hypothetical protein
MVSIISQKIHIIDRDQQLMCPTSISRFMCLTYAAETVSFNSKIIYHCAKNAH